MLNLRWVVFTYVNPWRVYDIIRTSLHAEPNLQSPFTLFGQFSSSMNFRRHGGRREGRPPPLARQGRWGAPTQSSAQAPPRCVLVRQLYHTVCSDA